jgi:hypothetical protein
VLLDSEEPLPIVASSNQNSSTIWDQNRSSQPSGGRSRSRSPLGAHALPSGVSSVALPSSPPERFWHWESSLQQVVPYFDSGVEGSPRASVLLELVSPMLRPHNPERYQGLLRSLYLAMDRVSRALADEVPLGPFGPNPSAQVSLEPLALCRSRCRRAQLICELRAGASPHEASRRLWLDGAIFCRAWMLQHEAQESTVLVDPETFSGIIGALISILALVDCRMRGINDSVLGQGVVCAWPVPPRDPELPVRGRCEMDGPWAPRVEGGPEMATTCNRPCVMPLVTGPFTGQHHGTCTCCFHCGEDARFDTRPENVEPRSIEDWCRVEMANGAWLDLEFFDEANQGPGGGRDAVSSSANHLGHPPTPPDFLWGLELRRHPSFSSECSPGGIVCGAGFCEGLSLVRDTSGVCRCAHLSESGVRCARRCGILLVGTYTAGEHPGMRDCCSRGGHLF